MYIEQGVDMWRPYKEAVTTVLPRATIVVDKFHVLRMATAALEVARKDRRSRLSRAQRRRLMHDRFLLLKRRRRSRMLPACRAT